VPAILPEHDLSVVAVGQRILGPHVSSILKEHDLSVVAVGRRILGPHLLAILPEHDLSVVAVGRRILGPHVIAILPEHDLSVVAVARRMLGPHLLSIPPELDLSVPRMSRRILGPHVRVILKEPDHSVLRVSRRKLRPHGLSILIKHEKARRKLFQDDLALFVHADDAMIVRRRSVGMAVFFFPLVEEGVLHTLIYQCLKGVGHKLHLDESVADLHIRHGAQLARPEVTFNALTFVDMTVVGDHRVDRERKGDRAHEMLQHFCLVLQLWPKKIPYQTAMWHLLDDDMLSHIATIGAWESLHVLRQLERRCAQIERATTRLRCIRPLFFPPFSIPWKEISILDLSAKRLDDGAMPVFAAAVASGAFPQIQVLSLGANKIGNFGMQSFTSVVASGALAKLEVLSLRSNLFGDVGMEAFTFAVVSGSLPDLTHLYIDNNQIGDSGMKAFASAVGSLPQLRELYLFANQIGDGGMQALASAVASGSLASLKEIWVDNARHPQLMADCQAHGIRIV